MATIAEQIQAEKERRKQKAAQEQAIQAQPGPTLDKAQLDQQAREERLKRIAVTSMRKFQGEPGATDIGMHDFSLGLTRPVTAVAGALGGEVGELFGGEPATLGERYRTQRDAYDEYLRQARENSGVAGKAAGAIGSIATLPERGALSVPKIIAEGALSSGTQSLAEGEGPRAAVTAALTGGATSGILGGLSARLLGREGRAAQREVDRGVPPEVLRDQAQALYSRLDQAGVAYDPTQAGTLMQNIQADLTREGYNPKIQQRAAAVVDEFNNRISGNQPLSLDALQDLRQQARAAGSSIEPEDRRIAGILMDHIDRFIEKTDPAMSVSGMLRTDIADTWREARSKWRAYNNTEDLLWNVSKAERRAATANSGANTENALRQNIRQTLDRATRPRRMSPYNDAEIAAMERVVRGSPVQNTLRATGNRLGGSGPLGMAGAGGLSGGAGLAAFGSGLVGPQEAALISTGLSPILWGAGKLARGAASDMAERDVDDLIRLVSSEGVQSPRVQAIMQGPPTRARLALMQFLAGASTGGGRIAGQEAPY